MISLDVALQVLSRIRDSTIQVVDGAIDDTKDGIVDNALEGNIVG
jgi:hypothetical protein